MPKYIHYTDFLKDKKFILWQLTPDEELKDENTQETVDEEIADAEETAEDTAEDTEAKEDDASGEKKSFFKKDKKKDKKDQLIEELTDKYKRTFAECNFSWKSFSCIYFTWRTFQRERIYCQCICYGIEL